MGSLGSFLFLGHLVFGFRCHGLKLASTLKTYFHEKERFEIELKESKKVIYETDEQRKKAENSLNKLKNLIVEKQLQTILENTEFFDL